MFAAYGLGMTLLHAPGSSRIAWLVVFVAVLLGRTVGAGEVRVDPSRVPPAVRLTLKTQFPDAKVRRYATERDNGVLVYEATLETNHHLTDVNLSPDGRILLREERIERSALPDPVARAFAGSAYGSGKVLQVERIFEGQDPTPQAFEILVRKGRSTLELKYAPDGRLLEEERTAATTSR
jgi:hypothetical protein